MKQSKTDLYYFIPVIIFIIIWELIGRYGLLDYNILIPSFTDTIIEMFILIKKGILVPHFLYSFLRVITGLFIGSSLGIIIGIIMGYNRFIDNTFRPIFSLLLPIPALGWLPLLIIWFGISEIIPILIIFICSFFPILYNTITGIKNVNINYIRVAETLGASKKKILFSVLLPLALPNIFTGLRLEAGMAWRVIIAAEMVAIPTGLGALLMRAESLIRIDIIIVVLIILSIMCFCFEKIILLIENKLTGKWKI